MKKKTMLIILSLLILSMFATSAMAFQPKDQGMFTKFFNEIRIAVQSIFGEIGTNPGIWLRVMLFAVIFAILYGVFTRDELGINDHLDNKTIGILAFVIALATAALSKENWIVNIFSMYQGVLLAILYLFIPLVSLFFGYLLWKSDEYSDSWFAWFIMLIVVLVNMVIWSEMNLITEGVATWQRLGLNLKLLGFTESLVGWIIFIGAGFVVFMLIKSGWWAKKVEESEKEGRKKGARKRLSEKKEKRSFWEKISGGGKQLKQLPDTENTTNTLLGYIDTAKTRSVSADRTEILSDMVNALKKITELRTQLVEIRDVIEDVKKSHKELEDDDKTALQPEIDNLDTKTRAIAGKINEIRTKCSSIKATSSDRAVTNALNAAETKTTELLTLIPDLEYESQMVMTSIQKRL